MNLTLNFTLEEFCESDNAVRAGINNTIVDHHILENAKRMCSVLEIVRAYAKRPVDISSGYRNVETNKLAGGSQTSAHTKGLAADIKIKGLTPKEVCLMILSTNIEFDQLIYEGAWTHIGLSEAGTKPRRQILTAIFKKGEKTKYIEGIRDV